MARGTGAPRQEGDKPTVRMPHAQVRELLGNLLQTIPTRDEINADPAIELELDDARPTTQRPRKRTAAPIRKSPQLRRSTPDELIALLRRSGLKEPRR